MIKLKDILREISSNTQSYGNADAGEPDTGWTSAYKTRTLGINKNKPEPWFEKGRYEQLVFPQADDPYKGVDTQNTQMYRVIKKITNIGNKYSDYLDSIASWDKHGVDDYSTDFQDD
jgi:hypothetical protein